MAWGVVTVTLAVVGVLAYALPARRAVRVARWRRCAWREIASRVFSSPHTPVGPDAPRSSALAA